MKGLVLSIALSAFLFISATSAILAQAPASTIQGGSRIEYRFLYSGDGSTIRVTATETDVNNLVVSIYTDDQIEALRRNEKVTPVGRATRLRDDALQWAGGFRFQATFHIVVENRAANALTYRLTAAGDGVSSFSRVASFGLSSSTQVVTQNGQKKLALSLPPGAITKTLFLPLPIEPETCTPPSKIANPLRQSVKLCPSQTYSPINVEGDNIAILGDEARSPVIVSNGRQFAMTISGSNNWIDGVTIQANADPRDLGAWLCLYDECQFATRPTTTTIRGGFQYGGGILLYGSNTTVRRMIVRSGTIGIATLNGHGNFILENNLSDLNGWGSYNYASSESYFVGNDLSRNNHGCTTPDGRKFATGCETAGWVCIDCTLNVVAQNYCESSANCFYISGERKLPSNANNFLSNYCAGATENCFEITFSFGNYLRDNIATYEPKSNRQCKYPFWIGGSIAYFANNTWECAISENDAFNQSRNSTSVATNIIRMDNYLGTINAPRIDPSQLATVVVPLPALPSLSFPQSRWAPEMTE